MISKKPQFHPIKIRSRKTFNKIKSTNIRLLMRNEVSKLASLYKLTKQNNVLASLHKFTKKTIQARPFLLRDRKNVSISMLFQKVFLGWKLSPIINRREVGIRMSGVEKIKTIISEGTSIRHSRVNKVERDSRVVLKKLALKVAKMTQRYGF